MMRRIALLLVILLLPCTVWAHTFLVDEQSFLTQEWPFLVENISVPAITSTTTGWAFVDRAYSYQATATGHPTPTWTISGEPLGMVIDAATGLVSGWTPALDEVGSVTFTVTATNSEGFVSQLITITVRERRSGGRSRMKLGLDL